MERLALAGVRIGGSRVQAAQFDARPKNVAHAIEEFGEDNRPPEDLALVDEVRETASGCFGLELVTGAIAFLFEDVENPPPQLAEQTLARGEHEALEEHVTLLV